tara:strand:- start:35 stop:385 length:351 start_codon:yes stop_codon:yes gene_type:complete
MDFKTNLAGYDVTINKKESKELSDVFLLEGAFTVEWQYYAEFRQDYIKELGVYATRVIGVVYKDDESVNEEDRLQIDSDDKGWTVKSDTIDLQWGNCIQPQDIYVDLDTKQIIVNF